MAGGGAQRPCRFSLSFSLCPIGTKPDPLRRWFKRSYALSTISQPDAKFQGQSRQRRVNFSNGAAVASTADRSRLPSQKRVRSEEHTSELPPLMRVTYDGLRLEKK